MKNTSAAQKLLNSKAVSPQVLSYLQLLVNARLPGIIVGPTQSGKTTILNAIIDFNNKYFKTYVLENKPELRERRKNKKTLLISELYGGKHSRMCITRAVKSNPDVILLEQVRLGWEEVHQLKQVLLSNYFVVSTMRSKSKNYAIAKLKTQKIIECWKWIAFTKKTDNKAGFLIDSVYEIIAQDNIPSLVNMYKSDEVTVIASILKKTYHLRKRHELLPK